MNRHEFTLLKENTKRLFENGVNIKDDIYINSYDFDFEKVLDIPIKDVFTFELSELKEVDPMYLQYHLDEIKLFENINRKDVVNNWWRYGRKDKNKLKYLTIATPHLMECNDYNIVSLMNSHYHRIYGYGEEFNLDYKFYKVKDSKYYELKPNIKYGNTTSTSELISRWLLNNKNSSEFLFYIDIIQKVNKEHSLLTEPIMNFSGTKNNQYYSLFLPFHYNKSHRYLFENIDSFKFIQNNKYSEDYFEKHLLKNDAFREFYKQFIPKKELIKKIKRRKYRIKKS